MRGQGDGFVGCINEPTQNYLLSRPKIVTFLKLLDGDGLFAKDIIGGIIGTEDRVNGMKRSTTCAQAVEPSLSSLNKIIDIDIYISEGWAEGTGVKEWMLLRYGGGEWDRARCNGFQRMGRRHIGWCLLKLFIDQVCDGFSEGREGRRRLCPTHGQPSRDGNEWGFTRQVWKRHGEFEGSGWSEWKLVETIGQVSLG
jgi:hypothetical protein